MRTDRQGRAAVGRVRAHDPVDLADLHLPLEAVAQPPGAERAEDAPHQIVAGLGREVAVGVRVVAEGPQGPGATEGRLGAQLRLLPRRRPEGDPAAAAGHHPDLRARLRRQRRRLQRGLAGADDDQVLAGVAREVVLLGAVGDRARGRGPVRRGRGELGRQALQTGQAGRHDDRAGGEQLARVQLQFEAAALVPLHRHHPHLLQLGHQLLPEPLAVGDERLDRDDVLVRHQPLDAGGVAVVDEVVPLLRGVEIGCGRSRLQEHSDGHVVAPADHGVAEDADGDAARSQMGGGRQAEGPGADDCYRLNHEVPPQDDHFVTSWPALAADTAG